MSSSKNCMEACLACLTSCEACVTDCFSSGIQECICCAVIVPTFAPYVQDSKPGVLNLRGYMPYALKYAKPVPLNAQNTLLAMIPVGNAQRPVNNARLFVMNLPWLRYEIRQ